MYRNLKKIITPKPKLYSENVIQPVIYLHKLQRIDNQKSLTRLLLPTVFFIFSIS